MSRTLTLRYVLKKCAFLAPMVALLQVGLMVQILMYIYLNCVLQTFETVSFHKNHCSRLSIIRPRSDQTFHIPLLLHKTCERLADKLRRGMQHLCIESKHSLPVHGSEDYRYNHCAYLRALIPSTLAERVIISRLANQRRLDHDFLLHQYLPFAIDFVEPRDNANLPETAHLPLPNAIRQFPHII